MPDFTLCALIMSVLVEKFLQSNNLNFYCADMNDVGSGGRGELGSPHLPRQQ